MPIIAQMSPHLADLIAAGEVVERPGSVVKELVENSIDAGATHITIEIQNGGMTLIRVTDDGCGMDRTDAQTAFLRHATSKLKREEDLAAIGTLGFRGEALAAIASVSRISLLTCTSDSDEGTALELEGGKVTSCVPAGCPKGTTILVRELFYNTPARLKFMKTDMAEGANVTAALQRLAIAHPEISFRMLRDGQEVVRTTGDGKLLSSIYTVFGRQMAADMLPVESTWEKLTVTGYVSRPLSTRGNRSAQMFYVNGRFIRSRTLTAALEEAYRNQMITGRYPTCVLNLTVPLGMVDVNVHPAKTEVRFLNEKSVYDCVYYAVLGTLGKASGRRDVELPKQTPHAQNEKPAAQAESTAAAVKPQAAPQKPQIVSTASHTSGTGRQTPKQDFYRHMTAEEYRNAAAALGDLGRPSREAVDRLLPKQEKSAGTALHSDIQTPSGVNGRIVHTVEEPVSRTPEPPAEQKAPEAPEAPENTEIPAVSAQESVPDTISIALPEKTPAEQSALSMPAAQAWRVIGEALDCFFIVEEAGAILLIDKHAAHERINFERLKKQDNSAMAQLLLTPVPASLSREEAAVLLENKELLQRCGFELDDFGDHTVLMRAIPDDLDESDAEALLSEMAEGLLSGKDIDPDARRDSLLHMISCKAAIKGGWHTEPAERDALIREVMTRDDLKYCPHGRPICIRITENQLRHQFERS